MKKRLSLLIIKSQDSAKNYKLYLKSRSTKPFHLFAENKIYIRYILYKNQYFNKYLKIYLTI